MTRVSENVRIRAECVTKRGESRSLWMRLRYPAPEDPFGPTEGFSEDAVRLAILGCTYLELAEIMGNSVARQHLHRELLRERVSRASPHFMNHRQGYRDAYESYQRHLRDFPPTDESRR